MQSKYNKLICVGAVPQEKTNKIHQRSYVYDSKGLSPTICATDFKDPKRILVRPKHNNLP